MCETWFEVLTIVLLVLNTGYILAAAARHLTPTKWRHFWVSSLVFVVSITLMYYQIVSECHMTYTKVVALFVAFNIVVLAVDCQICLQYFFS